MSKIKSLLKELEEKEEWAKTIKNIPTGVLFKLVANKTLHGFEGDLAEKELEKRFAPRCIN